MASMVIHTTLVSLGARQMELEMMDENSLVNGFMVDPVSTIYVDNPI
jgi:hypothetical protein